jgi:sarcosine oxidase subunit alpha
MMSARKDYIGRMMAGREGLTHRDREVVVGIRPVDRKMRLRSGSHLLSAGSKPSMANDQGYVTAVAYSPMLEHWVGLALLKRGRERHGEVVQVFDDLRRARRIEAEICDPVHYDRENVKLHA